LAYGQAVVAAFTWCPKLIITMVIYHGNLLVQATNDNELASLFRLARPLSTLNGLSGKLSAMD
jgi:hypothetical protein